MTDNAPKKQKQKSLPRPGRVVSLLRRLAGAREGNICIGGYAGCGNIGDDAIVQGFLTQWTARSSAPSQASAPLASTAGATIPPDLRLPTDSDDSNRNSSPVSDGRTGGKSVTGATASSYNGSQTVAPSAGIPRPDASAAKSPPRPCCPERLRQVTLLSGSPRLDARRYGVRCAGRKNPFAVLRALLRSERFLCGGGSLLQNATGSLSLCYYLSLLRLARLCGCRTSLLAAGIGPLHGARAARAVVRELNRCTRVELRDPDSLRLLASLGVRRELLHPAPDPAFYLPMPPPSRLPFLLRDAEIPQDVRYFCIALHPAGWEPETGMPFRDLRRAAAGEQQPGMPNGDVWRNAAAPAHRGWQSDGGAPVRWTDSGRPLCASSGDDGSTGLRSAAVGMDRSCGRSRDEAFGMQAPDGSASGGTGMRGTVLSAGLTDPDRPRAACIAPGDRTRVITASLRLIAARHHLMPVFLAFDTRTDSYPSQRMAAALGGTVVRLREASDALAILSGAEFLFAMRLHPLLFSVRAQIPALALSPSDDEPKLASFCRAAAIPHLVSPSIVGLTFALEQLIANRASICATLPGILRGFLEEG